MFKCSVCEFTTSSRESFAGHRSGHVRRGELEKQIKKYNGESQCPECDLIFPTKMSLTAHMKFHRFDWETAQSSGTLKRHLIAENGHKCSKCNLTEWLGQLIPLQLDHIDGNPTNNDRSNLRVLCPNCHAQTDTYAGRNVGRPRCSRDGKSYPSYRSAVYLNNQLRESEVQISGL